MPTTFYLCYEIIPGDEGLIDQRIEGGEAHCCIIADDPVSAAVKATYQIRRSGWRIKSSDTLPTAVCFEDFRGKDLGEKCFIEAQEMGIATVILAHTSDKELLSEAPTRQTPKEEFDLNDFLQTQSTVRSRGKCLFYQNTEDCQKIIDAHSIQKNGALSVIARDGYVYAGSTKFTDVKKSKGKLILAKTHINTMSTFRGLCQFHDNLVFRPIDMDALQPTNEQVFLYAYRSLLRERFAKECAVEIWNKILDGFQGTKGTRELIEGVRDGNSFGLASLKHQQSHFETSHKTQTFDDIRYVMFQSSKAPTSVFSGAILPDWGFNGEPIQNLSDRSHPWHLMTFSFAPTDQGWAFLCAWHKESDMVCRHFISTLQKAVKAAQPIEDLLFGLVVKGCENTAYSADWLERRTATEKQNLEDAMFHGADALQQTLSNYLQDGIAGMHEWKFDTVLDNLSRHS